MNKLAYTELLLTIDDKTSNIKVVFNLVKVYKNNDYADGNSNMSWERLRKKFEPQSDPSLVKMEKRNLGNVRLNRIKTQLFGSLSLKVAE